MISDFKKFVSQNPGLLKYVKNGEMTWQKFYEIYDLYGDSEEAWNPYLKKEETEKAVASTIGFADILTWLKNADLDKVEESINSVQRVIGVLQDLGDNKQTQTSTYKPRPLYKHFED
jgi:vacuolar-type H+-ATPase subunit I/STV1